MDNSFIALTKALGECGKEYGERKDKFNKDYIKFCKALLKRNEEGLEHIDSKNFFISCKLIAKILNTRECHIISYFYEDYDMTVKFGNEGMRSNEPKSYYREEDDELSLRDKCFEKVFIDMIDEFDGTFNQDKSLKHFKEVDNQVWLSKEMMFLLFIYMYDEGHEKKLNLINEYTNMVKVKEVKYDLVKNEQREMEANEIVKVKKIDKYKMRYISNKGHIEYFFDDMLYFFSLSEDRLLDLIKRKPYSCDFVDNDIKWIKLKNGNDYRHVRVINDRTFFIACNKYKGNKQCVLDIKEKLKRGYVAKVQMTNDNIMDEINTYREDIMFYTVSAQYHTHEDKYNAYLGKAYNQIISLDLRKAKYVKNNYKLYWWLDKDLFTVNDIIKVFDIRLKDFKELIKEHKDKFNRDKLVLSGKWLKRLIVGNKDKFKGQLNKYKKLYNKEKQLFFTYEGVKKIANIILNVFSCRGLRAFFSKSKQFNSDYELMREVDSLKEMKSRIFRNDLYEEEREYNYFTISNVIAKVLNLKHSTIAKIIKKLNIGYLFKYTDNGKEKGLYMLDSNECNILVNYIKEKYNIKRVNRKAILSQRPYTSPLKYIKLTLEQIKKLANAGDFGRNKDGSTYYPKEELYNKFMGVNVSTI